MDLNLKLFSVHSSFLAQIPFVLFVLAAVGLQYFQMAQINNRSRKTGQAMPAQQQAMQRFLPLIFAYFYMIIPAAVVLYMIISTSIRILTQYLMFRTGLSDPTKNGVKASTHRAEIEEEHKDGANRPHVEEIPGAAAVEREQTKGSSATNPIPASLNLRTSRRPNPQPPSRKHSLAPKRSVKERRVNPWIG